MFRITTDKKEKAVLGELKQLQQSVYQMHVILAEIQSTDGTDTGNPYKTYKSAIEELGRKYEGIADWGSYQARSIIDVRAAFTIGNGIKAVTRNSKTKKSEKVVDKKFQKELEYIEAFLEANDLDEEGAHDYAKEAEIEGRTLFKLIPNKDTKTIDLRFVSYTTHNYEIESDPEDYKIYEKATWRTAEGEEVSLQKKEFVYKKFAGRADKVNDIMPTVATILRLLEDLDKALKDFRSINNLFASPTPHFDCEDETAASNLYQKLKDINWKIGKFLVTAKAKFTMVSADASGAESLVKEITNLVKMISGVTGIPVHFLGLPDLMSNRSTSTDMFEMIIASTTKVRKTWIGNYEEIFTKVLTMSNDNFGTSFITDSISCEIPQVTAAKLKELNEVWLPLFLSNVIDFILMRK